jgi:hypothetical protein
MESSLADRKGARRLAHGVAAQELERLDRHWFSARTFVGHAGRQPALQREELLLR